MTALQRNQVMQLVAKAKKEAPANSVSYRTYEEQDVVALIAEALDCFNRASSLTKKPINSKKFATEARFIQAMLASNSLEMNETEVEEDETEYED